MLQPAILAEHNVRPDHAIRPDHCARAEFRSCIHNRGRMNPFPHLSRNVNISSPSETTASLTTQWHFALARRSPRALVSSA